MTTTSADALLEEIKSGPSKVGGIKPRKPIKKPVNSVLISADEAPVQLTQVNNEEGVEIDPAEIYINPEINQRIHTNEIRKRDKSFLELRESLKTNGQIQSIMVRPCARPGHSYELIYGSRRLYGCMAEDMKVRAIIKPMSNEDALATAYIENDERDDYWPIEEARAYMYFLGNESAKAPKYRIRKYESYGVSTKNRLLDFASLPDEFVECCSNPSGLTEKNTRQFRSHYRKNKQHIDRHIQTILNGKARYIPSTLISTLLQEKKIKTRRAVQYRDARNNVVLSIGGAKKLDGKLTQIVTLYENDSETIDDLITTLSAIKKRLDVGDTVVPIKQNSD